jgi:hypothetical protein
MTRRGLPHSTEPGWWSRIVESKFSSAIAEMQPVFAEVNRVNDRVLVRYYETEWKDIAP